MNDKRTQREALEQTVRFFETVFNISNDGILITDFSGAIIQVNRSLASIFGQSVEDMLETNLLCWLERFDANGPKIWSSLLNKIHREKRIHRFEHSVGECFFEINGALIQGKGESQSVLWVWRNVTEQKLAEEEAKKHAVQLEAVNSELKDFDYIVSHDLKAPLRAVSNLTEWIAKDYGDAFDEKGKKLIDLLLGRVKRMVNLIDGILQYSRLGRVRGKEETVDLNTVVKEAIDLIAVPDNFQIIIESPLPALKGNKTRFVQIFENLMDNALKFTDKANGEVRIACKDDNDRWRFSVADNGPGIDSSYHEKIFRIFQTLVPRDELESTGIGLTLVKKIVEGGGGRIWLESEAGKGSTFFFTWPK